jgi:hypothetical protein
VTTPAAPATPRGSVALMGGWAATLLSSGVRVWPCLPLSGKAFVIGGVAARSGIGALPLWGVGIAVVLAGRTMGTAEIVRFLTRRGDERVSGIRSCWS